MLDDILLASFVAGSKDPDAYVISSDAFSKPEPYGIMLRKDDPAFKKVVDDATAAVYTSGEGQKIYDKWFMQKIPPKGLNLNTADRGRAKNEFAKPSDSPDPILQEIPARRAARKRRLWTVMRRRSDQTGPFSLKMARSLHGHILV